MIQFLSGPLGECWENWWEHFGIEKTRELVARKCYEDLQLLPIRISGWKDLLIGKTWVTTRAKLPMSINWNDTSNHLGRIAYVYQLERHESRLKRDCLCLLIDQLWLAWKRATIWSFSLSAYTISLCRYQSMHLGLQESISPLTQSLATKTQSPPLSSGSPDITLSWTAVTTCASFMRTANKNLITAYRKNLQYELVTLQIPFRRTFQIACMDLAIDLIYELVMYGKSLSARSLRLCAWIWSSTSRMFSQKFW